MRETTMIAAIACVCVLTALAENEAKSEPDWQQVERIGPPRMYSPQVERYRFGHTNVNNPDFYPIPQAPVTRDTYMAWIEESGMLDYANQPKRGLGGPTQLLPVLAKYVQTREAKWGEACIAMLKDFHRGTQEEVAQKGWTEQFADPPALIPLYRKLLIEGGMLAPDEPWFREMWLYCCRNLHVWGSEPIEWRGPCHRSMPEALAKGLAAKWYPDIPEAAHWTHYSDQVVEDFWSVKDLLQNDTGYFQDSVRAYSFSSDQLFGDERYLSDPGMQPIWERLVAEITPDGAINPYGPNGGWNSTAALRVGVLERVATATRNRRYRYAAHKAMNYLLYQMEPILRDHYLRERETAVYIVLAYLFADDTLEPEMPHAGSLVTHRREVARMPHRDKQIVGRYLKDLDPHPERANLCCNQAFTARTFPDKLVLRSGWHPGDFFALVELNPTSFPFNAGGIMGLNRWGAPFTQVVSSKGDIPENRMAIVDLSGQVQRRLLPDPDRISEEWKRGEMPDITASVPLFHDAECATIARLEVQNPQGLPVRYVREFVLGKNRFLVTRETAVFEEGFPAQVAAVWNTQNVGPQIGAHWANTFMGAPVASNGRVSMNTPPADLLVYFAPQPGWRMQVTDRTWADPRTESCPAQVSYLWEGATESGQQLHSTQVYYPHAPSRARASTVNIGATAVYSGGEIAATAGASGISVLVDTPQTTLLRTEFEEGRAEWVLFNPQGGEVVRDDFQTDARYAFVGVRDGGIDTYLVVESTFLNLDKQEVFRYEERTTVKR